MAKQKSIKEIVYGIIADFEGLKLADITDASTLENLGIDSISGVELIMTLEEHFNQAVPDEIATAWKNVGDCILYFTPGYSKTPAASFKAITTDFVADNRKQLQACLAVDTLMDARIERALLNADKLLRQAEIDKAVEVRKAAHKRTRTPSIPKGMVRVNHEPGNPARIYRTPQLITKAQYQEYWERNTGLTTCLEPADQAKTSAKIVKGRKVLVRGKATVVTRVALVRRAEGSHYRAYTDNGFNFNVDDVRDTTKGLAAMIVVKTKSAN